ncbi:hypothetical protein RRF57_009635 [Xylaria bambusicola]|uniref:Uncharacterized protein n=1 Tax=Xylaria bambusicola TaxID=326684 RepID=A0AAN7ZC28_9PEZI
MSCDSVMHYDSLISNKAVLEATAQEVIFPDTSRGPIPAIVGVISKDLGVDSQPGDGPLTSD